MTRHQPAGPMIRSLRDVSADDDVTEALSTTPSIASRHKIASLAGLAPINRDSSSLRGRPTIAGVRGPRTRRLFMGVMVSLRHELPRSLTLRALGKPPKLAITAYMRKLLTILNEILRDQKPWQKA